MTPAERFRLRWRNRPRRAMISVHRGLWGPLPENSLAAVTLGARLGIVEVDLQLASDGKVVVMHDDMLERMTGEGRPVGRTTSAEIARLHLREGAGGDSPLTAWRVPLLADLLAAPPEDIVFDFDVKHPKEVDAIASILGEAGAGARGSIKIDTATDADIARLRMLEERHGLMVAAKVVLPESGPDHIRALVDAGVAVAEVAFDDPDQIRAAAAIAGDRMALTTCTLDPVHYCGLSDTRAGTDPEGVWGKLIEAGVTILMTDRAPLLDAWLG